jgi:hypothetical protein
LPEGFVEFTTPRSGIHGTVLSAPHPYSLRRFVAFTMTDGCEHDFTDHIAPAWRVMLGDGTLDYDSEWFPILRGKDVYFGYGSVAADEHALALAESRWRRGGCGEPNGAANRSQPGGPQTNRSSAAAGSGG